MGKRSLEIKSSVGMFDLIRGYVMILVVFVHTYGLGFPSTTVGLWGACAFLIICQAIMPAMFIISGYGFRKMKPKKCIQQQWKTLGVLYVKAISIAIVLHMICHYLLYRNRRDAFFKTLGLVISAVFGFSKPIELNGIYIQSNGNFWFLLALMVANIVFNQLLNHFSGKKLAIAVVITAIAGWGLSHIAVMPWAIPQGLIATMYVGLGYWLKKAKVYYKPSCFKYMIILTVICIPLSLLLTDKDILYMASSSYPYGPASIIVYGLLAVPLVYFSLFLNGFKGKWSTFVRTIGRNTAYFYSIHAIELLAVGQYVQYDFVNNWQGSYLTRVVLVFGVRFAAVTAVTFAFVWLKEHFRRA